MAANGYRKRFAQVGSGLVVSFMIGCSMPDTGISASVPSISPTIATGAAARQEAKLQANAPTLYYVTAADCPSCQEWESQFHAAFDRSPERAKLRFVILHSPTVRRGAYMDATWPSDLRWIRGELMKQKVMNALPLFVLVRNNSVIAVNVGEDTNYPPFGWDSGLLSAIRQQEGAL